MSQAEDAHEAMSILERCDEVMLLLSDVRMPGHMDGVDLAQWLRQHRADMKVILMSGYIPDTDQRALARRFDAFIPKPFKVEELVRRTRELTSNC